MGLREVWLRQKEKEILPKAKPRFWIWLYRDRKVFLDEMELSVSEKSGYGEKVERLSREERVFYVVRQLTAEISGEALKVFGCELPADLDERTELLENLENDEICALLAKADADLRERREQVEELTCKYIQDHKKAFR